MAEAIISRIPYGKAAGWRITQAYTKDDLLKSAIEYVVDRGVSRLASRCPQSKLDEVKELSQRLALFALSDTGNRSIYLPVAQYGALSAIDRDEIESYRSIYALLHRYATSDQAKPISLAVFGPPGSGKSFGVEEIAKAIRKDGEPAYDVQKVNMAQFVSADDLVIPLLKAGETKKKTPLIFFDEFDCSLLGEELGWLRYLLQPMQDGEYKHGEQIRAVGRAVFVFAGGTSHSFSAFAREETGSEVEKKQFRLAKGPDFASRLSGHVNVLGIDPIGENDTAYVLRRAIVLRAFVEKYKWVDSGLICLVDRSFLDALLRVTHFRHGARSMEKILTMCVGDRGGLKVPAISQLEMHVVRSEAEELSRHAG